MGLASGAMERSLCEGRGNVRRIHFEGIPMKIQYLHLSVYLCEKCNGPVVAGVLAVRENEISRETDIRQVWALCLTCGHSQQKPKEPGHTRNFPPIRCESVNAPTDTRRSQRILRLLRLHSQRLSGGCVRRWH